MDQPEGAAKGVLHLYRRFRDHIASTALGRQLVLRYYDDRVQSSINQALSRDRQLTWELLVLLVEAQPLLNSLLRPSGLASGCHRDPILDEALADRLMEFADKLNQATKGAVADELNQVKALIQQGIGRTPGELFVLLELSPVSGKQSRPRRPR